MHPYSIKCRPYLSSISVQQYTSSIFVPAFNAPVLLLYFCASCESLSQLSWKSSPPLSLHQSPTNVFLTLLSKLLSWKSSPLQEISLECVPKWNPMYFIYPIRVILMTFHLQRTRLDLSQEIYGWDLIFRSLKSPKWTLHEIFLIEKSHHPKY